MPSSCSARAAETRRCSPAGTRCIPAMKLRIARPSKLVDLGRLVRPRVREGRRHARRDRRAHASRGRRRRPAAPASTARSCPTPQAQIGDPQVRHRGTIGRHALARRPGVGHARRDARARRRARRARARAASGRSRPRSSSPGVFETAARRRTRCSSEVRVPKLGASAGLGVPQGEPPRPGLGDGRRRGARAPRRRQGRGRLDRAREHGRHAAACPGRGGRARRRRVGRRRCGARREREPSRRPTRPARRSTVRTWRRCSRGARSSRRWRLTRVRAAGVRPTTQRRTRRVGDPERPPAGVRSRPRR